MRRSSSVVGVLVTALVVSILNASVASAAPAIGKSQYGSGGSQGDPHSPSYGKSYSEKLGSDTLAPSSAATTQTVRCGVNVYDSLNNLVAKLWEDVNISWYQYDWIENWASRGTWAVDFRYGWTSLTGPSPSSGDFYYTKNQQVRTSGTVTYFGVGWHNFTVTLQVNGNQQWGCHATQNW
jgi:hypothetical protein